MMSDHRTDPSSNRRADRDDGVSPVTLGSAAAVTLSVLASLGGSVVLPNRLRVHWTLGAGPYYGPEFAPTVVVLVAFPLLVVATAVAGRWGIQRVRTVDPGAETRLSDAALLAGMAGLVAIQLALFAGNL